MGANDNIITDNCSCTEKLKKQMAILKEKADNLKNCSRRTIVRIINIPEKMAGWAAAESSSCRVS